MYLCEDQILVLNHNLLLSNQAQEELTCSTVDRAEIWKWNIRLVWTKWMKGWFCIEEKTGKRMCRYAREQSLIYRIQVSASEKELVKSIPKLQSGPCWKTYSKKSACKFCRNLNSFNSSDWSVGSVFITTLLTLHYFSSDQNLEFLYDKLSS